MPVQYALSSEVLETLEEAEVHVEQGMHKGHCEVVTLPPQVLQYYIQLTPACTQAVYSATLKLFRMAACSRWEEMSLATSCDPLFLS